MITLKTTLSTDIWVKATWDEYLQILNDPDYKWAKGYYYNGNLRIETMPTGSDHACDHTVMIVAIGLFAALKQITLTGRDNCTYRKTGVQEAQPDVSYYIGENANAIPWGTTIVDLDLYPSPDLVIEIANTSLSDDKGEKRLLYEDLRVKEYWIVDVQNVRIIAFAMTDRGSNRINQSQILPGLEISLLEEAFQRTRQMNQSEVINWLMSKFQE